MQARAVPQFLLVALIALTLVPTAQAHGALEAREIDVRILADSDGAIAPGGCSAGAEQTCANPANLGGLDLLTLDAREARFANGTAYVAFRIAFQGGKPGVAQEVQLLGKAAGKAFTFSFAGADGAYNSTTCDGFEGPVDYPGGDGAQQAVDCYAAYSTLGVNGTGAELSDISLVSLAGGKKFDAVPGTWYLNDQLTPFVPNAEEPTEGAETELGTYTLTGPARLLGATLSANRADVKSSPVRLQVQLSNLLNKTDQVATLNMSTPATVQASLDASTAILRNGTSSAVALDVVGATKDGTITIVVTSDLGAYEVLTVAVVAPPPAPSCPSGNQTMTGMSGMSHPPGCPTGTGTSTSNASGAPESIFVAGLLLALAVTRRRA